MKMLATKRIVYTAVFVALNVLLPYLFHFIPNGGAVFQPMYLPAIICSMVCGCISGMVCGILGVILSFVLTGMPAMAILPSMLAECITFALIAGLLFRFIRTRKLLFNIYASLIPSVLIGRIVGGFVKAVTFTSGTYSLSVWATSYFVTGAPGLIIELIIVPIIIIIMIKARLINCNYHR